MRIWSCLVAAAIVIITIPSLAFDLSPFLGTMEVQFMPMQSAGIREGCSLVYRVVGKDFAYRKGNLVTLAGNISYSTNKNHTNVGLSLKLGTFDSLNPTAEPEAPFFAYLQTPHGTTARSKFAEFDSPDMQGFRLFGYQFDDDVMRVYGDVVNGESVTIGFNRKKDGLDVLVPLDLTVAETTLSADGSINRRRSDEMLLQFLSCVTEVTEQVQKQMERK